VAHVYNHSYSGGKDGETVVWGHPSKKLLGHTVSNNKPGMAVKASSRLHGGL
jgi:hypothetical protein